MRQVIFIKLVLANIILAFTFLSCTSSQNTDNDLAILGLSGPVKLILTEVRNDTGLVSQNDLFGLNEIYHNSDEVKRFLIRGEIVRAQIFNRTYEFDKNGFLPDSTFFKRNKRFQVNAPTDSLQVFEGDRLVKVIKPVRGSEYILEYNDEGWISSMKEIDIKYKPNNLLGTQEYTYDPNGVMLKTLYLHPRSSGLKEYHYEIKLTKFDAYNNWTEAKYIYGIIGRKMNELRIVRVIEYY